MVLPEYMTVAARSLNGSHLPYQLALNRGIYNVSPFNDTGIPEVVWTNVRPVTTVAAEFGKLYVVSIKLVKSSPVGVSPVANAFFKSVTDIIAMYYLLALKRLLVADHMH